MSRAVFRCWRFRHGCSTAELERRWNLTLQHVREIEIRIQQHNAEIDQGPETTNENFHPLARQLEDIWTFGMIQPPAHD